MNWKEINDLIKDIRIINHHQSRFDRDPLLEEDLFENLNDLRTKYGTFIMDKLKTLYTNYFPFDEVDYMESYLRGRGVKVEEDESGIPRLYVSLKAHPLRIELFDPQTETNRVAWQAS